MAGVLVTSSEFSQFEANMPSASDVQTGMTRYTPRRNPRLGGWVGPTPRVTRKRVFGGYETDAAWLYAWPDTPYTNQNLADLQNVMRSQVDQGLQEVSSTFSEPVLTPYSEALHGPVSFWASGQAAVTQTRDNSPSAATTLLALQTPENPTGPTTAQTSPATLSNTVGSIFKSPVTWVVIGGIAVFVAWPYVKPLLRRMEPANAA